jgi:hypothetical protein
MNRYNKFFPDRFNRGDYVRGQYHSDRGDGMGYQARPVKHSGAGMKPTDDGRIVVWGWNYSKKRGMVKVYARPYKGTGKTKISKTGKEYWCLMATVLFRETGAELHEPVLADVQTGKFVYRSLGMVCNPKAANGGYFGHFGRSKN